MGSRRLNSFSFKLYPRPHAQSVNFQHKTQIPCPLSFIWKKTNPVPTPPACSLSKPWEPASHDIRIMSRCPDSWARLLIRLYGDRPMILCLPSIGTGYVHLWAACIFPSGGSNLPLCPSGHCLGQESWAPVHSCLSSVFPLFMVLGGFLKPLQNSSLLFPLQLSCRIEVAAAWRLPCCLREQQRVMAIVFLSQVGCFLEKCVT